VETVESFGGEHGQVVRPHFAVVEPRFIQRLAGELAHDAAHFVGGPLHGWRVDLQRIAHQRLVAHAVRYFEQGVHHSARIAGTRQERLPAAGLGVQQRQALRLVRRADSRDFQGCRRERRAAAGCNHAELVHRDLFHPFAPIERGPRVRHCLLQFPRRPLHGRGGSDGVGWIENQRDRALLAELRPCLRSAGKRTACEPGPAEKFPSMDVCVVAHVDPACQVDFITPAFTYPISGADVVR
jgi:hypothetical protein